MSVWDALAKFLAGVVERLLTIFVARKSGKDAERARQADRAVEVVGDINRPASQRELDELWERNKAKYD